MVHGESEIDVYESNIARAYPHQKTTAHIRARAGEGFNKMYGIVHPAEQWESDRGVRLSPVLRARAGAAARSSTRPPAGSARSGMSPTRRCSRSSATAINRREAEWESRWWSPIINAEHLAMRDRAGDDRPDRVRDLRRHRAGRARRRPARRDAPDGRRRRPRRLHAGADPERRLQGRPDDHAPGRRRVPRRHRRRLRDVRPQVVRRPPARRTARRRSTTRPTRGRRSGCGGRAPATSSPASPPTTSRNEGFPFARCKTIEVGPLQVLASRISYVGDLGWELYVPIEQGARLWDIIAEAGAAARRRPGRASASTAPPGAWRSATAPTAPSSRASTTSSRPAWPGARSRTQDFIGKEAHVRHREEEPAAIMCTLTVDDHTSAVRGQALHARRRADPDPRRRADHRRARAGAPT